MVFTDVLIVSRLDVDGLSFAPVGLHKKDASSDWLLIKQHCIGAGVQLQINHITKAVGVNLALTRKKMLIVIKESEEPPENSKTSRGPYQGLVL